MHLLGFCSLACSLLAAALLPGAREAPAAAAAFESGLGFSDAEPDAGEAKVGARSRAPGRPGSVGGTAGARVAEDPEPARSPCACVFPLVRAGSKVTERNVCFLGEKFSSPFSIRKLLLGKKASYRSEGLREVAGDSDHSTYWRAVPTGAPRGS